MATFLCTFSDDGIFSPACWGWKCMPTPFQSYLKPLHSSYVAPSTPSPARLTRYSYLNLPISSFSSSLLSVLWWNLQRAWSKASSVRGCSAASFLSTPKLLAFLLKHMSSLKSQESSRAGALVYPCRVSGGNSALLNTIREITEEDRCVSAVFLFPLSRQGERQVDFHLNRWASREQQLLFLPPSWLQ